MKIAIIKLSALGDIVHAMVALQFLKQYEPSLVIDWLVEPAYAGLLADNPDINQVLPVNIKALKTNKSLIFKQLASIKSYAAHNYDLVIDAQGLIKSALIARLLSSRCVGFDKASIREPLASYLYQQTIACPYDSNTIVRNVTVLSKPLGLTITQQQLLNCLPFLFDHGFDNPALNQYLSTSQKNIILVIGSTWPSRNYPKQQFLQIIKALAANYLVCWGSQQEYADALWLAEQCSAKVLPRLTLNDLKALIAQADLLIGNDTGPTHIAWGLGTRSITLFGPTPVSRVLQTPINKVLKSPSAVNPRHLNKNDFSIKEINYQEIVELAQGLLAN